MPEVKFRLYEDGDEQGIVDVINSSFSSFREWGLTTERWLRYESDDYAFKRANALVAEVGGRVVGHVQLITRRLRMGRDVYVECGGIANVSTHPDFRGRGIATRLMEMALRLCSERGVPLSALFTGYPGRPHRIYKRVGYGDTLLTHVLAAEVDEALEALAGEGGVRVEEAGAADVGELERVYEEAHRDYTGVAARPREYWVRKLLGNRPYYHTFFHESPDAFVRLKALRGGEVVGYAVGLLPTRCRWRRPEGDAGVILELVASRPVALRPLLAELLARFKEEGVRSVVADAPLADEYLRALEGFKVLRRGGIFMEAVPRPDLLFGKLSGELSARLEERGVRARLKVVVETIRGRVALKFDGHAVEPSDPQGADAVVRIEWDEFTRMVYGIEGFSELLASGAATVCARGVSRKVVRAMAAAFPRLKFHVWRVDHW